MHGLHRLNGLNKHTDINNNTNHAEELMMSVGAPDLHEGNISAVANWCASTQCKQIKVLLSTQAEALIPGVVPFFKSLPIMNTHELVEMSAKTLQSFLVTCPEALHHPTTSYNTIGEWLSVQSMKSVTSPILTFYMHSEQKYFVMAEVTFNTETQRPSLCLWKIGGYVDPNNVFKTTIKADIAWLRGESGFEFPLGWASTGEGRADNWDREQEWWLPSRALVKPNEETGRKTARNHPTTKEV